MDGHVFHNATSGSFPIANTAQIAVNIYSGSSMNDAVFDIFGIPNPAPAPPTSPPPSAPPPVPPPSPLCASFCIQYDFAVVCNGIDCQGCPECISPPSAPPASPSVVCRSGSTFGAGGVVYPGTTGEYYTNGDLPAGVVQTVRIDWQCVG